MLVYPADVLSHQNLQLTPEHISAGFGSRQFTCQHVSKIQK